MKKSKRELEKSCPCLSLFHQRNNRMDEEVTEKDEMVAEIERAFAAWGASNPEGIPVGYCGWPSCPICSDRGLVPEQAEESK